MKTIRRRTLAFFGFTVALLSLEIVLRLLRAGGDDFVNAIAARPPAPPGRELRLGEMIRPSPNDRIVYELRPHLHGRFVGQEVVTNSLGMRTPERPLEKTPGTFRIVGVGDSVMFGWGVAQSDAYLSRLERDLAERFPDRRFEVWNLAVPGYNAVQEVEAIAEKIDRLDPDLLVIGWVGNDMDLPNFLAHPPRVWALDRSFLAEFVALRWRASRDTEAVDAGLFEVPVDEATNRHVLRREEVPERYWPLAGWDNMKAAYGRLIGMAKDRAIPAVAVFAGGPRHFKKFCADAGFLVVESQHRVLRYETEHRVDRHVALQLSAADPHPNAIGHELIEQSLAERLLESSALAPRVPR